jgi:hypothetical protein
MADEYGGGGFSRKVSTSLPNYALSRPRYTAVTKIFIFQNILIQKAQQQLKFATHEFQGVSLFY